MFVGTRSFLNKKKIIILLFCFCLAGCLGILNVKILKNKIEMHAASNFSVPLEEIGKKIEYTYAYLKIADRMYFPDFGELGDLTEGREVSFTVYTVNGNKLLFLPKEKGNEEVMIDGELCSLYYSEERGGYLFYLIKDWNLKEYGVPANALENCNIKYCMVTEKSDKMKEDVKKLTNIYEYWYEGEYDLRDLRRLGEVVINLQEDKNIEASQIITHGNEYIDAVVEYIADVLREEEKYGSYDIYLGNYGRISDRYGDYTDAYVTVAIIGNAVREYAALKIGDNGDIGGVILNDPPSLENSPKYFSSYDEKESEYLISKVIGMQREIIKLEVEEYDNKKIEKKENLSEIENDNQEIDFRLMDSEEAAELIEYIISYCEYFGMNELGYWTGEIQEFDKNEIIMYTWSDVGDTLFFIPKDMVNTVAYGVDGVEYPLYVNKDGVVKFYCIERNPYANKTGQLKTTLIYDYNGPSEKDCTDFLTKIGEAQLDIREYSSLDVLEIEEDEYVSALENYVKDLLLQHGKYGNYYIYIGEYEALYTNKVCLSAAVVGEEEYYVRYLIVKSAKGNYYFWPIGFGLDASLNECENKSHQMNKLCIDRTKQLRHDAIAISIYPES